jgi:hypothetical protein
MFSWSRALNADTITHVGKHMQNMAETEGLTICESVTQVRSRKAHPRCATDAWEATGAQLLRSAPSGAHGFSAIALLLNLESFLFRTNSSNLRRIESCPLNMHLRCPNFTHSLMIHPSYK